MSLRRVGNESISRSYQTSGIGGGRQMRAAAAEGEDGAATAPSDNIQSPLIDSLAIVKSAAKGESITPDSISLGTRVNEQEWFAAIAHQELKNRSEKLAKIFEERLPEVMERVKEIDDKNFVFRAVKRIIRRLRRTGEITRETAITIRRFAVGKAQLDSDRTRLSTSRLTDAPGDTPLRSVKTALLKFGENVGATEQEINAFLSKNRRELRKIKQEQAQTQTELVGAPEEE